MLCFKCGPFTFIWFTCFISFTLLGSITGQNILIPRFWDLRNIVVQIHKQKYYIYWIFIVQNVSFFLCFWILPPITPYYLLAACSLVITFKLHINDYLFLLWSFGLMVCFVAILVAVSVIVLLFISRGEIKNSHVWVYIQFSCWWSAHLEIFVVIGSDTEFADPRNSQTMSSLATSLLEVTYYLEFLSVNP
jgi:hypothetical protein